MGGSCRHTATEGGTGVLDTRKCSRLSEPKEPTGRIDGAPARGNARRRWGRSVRARSAAGPTRIARQNEAKRCKARRGKARQRGRGCADDGLWCARWAVGCFESAAEAQEQAEQLARRDSPHTRCSHDARVRVCEEGPERVYSSGTVGPISRRSNDLQHVDFQLGLVRRSGSWELGAGSRARVLCVAGDGGFDVEGC